MKEKFIKLSVVFLLLLFGCNKEKWIEIKTTDNQCSYLGELMVSISDATGEIKPFGANEYLIVVNDISGHAVLPLYPCNISFSDLKKEHKIIISGEVYFIKGQNIDSIAISLAAQPILISNARIYK